MAILSIAIDNASEDVRRKRAWLLQGHTESIERLLSQSIDLFLLKRRV
jgi:hypothetical protein